MEQLDKYFELQKEIYDYFGYEEEWSVYPLDDSTQYYWFISDNQVWFYDTKEAYDSEDWEDKTYNNELLGDKPVHVTRTHTMIRIDSRTDGNKFLQIFNNSKMLPIK